MRRAANLCRRVAAAIPPALWGSGLARLTLNQETPVQLWVEPLSVPRGTSPSFHDEAEPLCVKIADSNSRWELE